MNVKHWEFDLSGSHFVGRGKVEIEYKLGSYGSGNLNETLVKWDAVRLNERSSGSKDWYLNFNELPTKPDLDSSLPATMYITIKFDLPTESGNFNSSFWHGKEAYIEIWSPIRSAQEPEAKRLLKFSLKKVQLSFEEVELRLNGKFIGGFMIEKNGNA